MNVTKRLFFLLIGMLIMSSFAFAGGTYRVCQFWKVNAFTSTANKQSFHAKHQLVTTIDISATSADEPATDVSYTPSLNKKPARCKKLFKRIVNFPSGPEPPTKEIDKASRFVPAKEIYSKPHFLSQLHRFLFRLTPF